MPGFNSSAAHDFDFTPIKADGDTVALAFSCGKDSLACWLACRDAGLKVRPYYQYQVPGIQFVERSLAYYEDYFGQPIMRVLHPVMYNWLRTLVHQPVTRAGVIYWLDPPKFSYDEIQAGIRRSIGLPNAWIAVGTKRNDSLMRRMRIVPGGLNTGARVFHPLAEWSDKDCIEIIAQNKVRVPVDYAIFGRSFDGIDYRYCKQVRDHFPEDYEVIKEWFPMIDMELFRAEVATRHGQNAKQKPRAAKSRPAPTA